VPVNSERLYFYAPLPYGHVSKAILWYIASQSSRFHSDEAKDQLSVISCLVLFSRQSSNPDVCNCIDFIASEISLMALL